ncbi:MAG: hypothetical protein HDS69_04045 [Bacteroidales bacterium]|nr:hypothetical protein [Bacteroidales bacterium]MBD5248127.1 hypothetical protein [Barnesiella sp.]MBD5258431.1 hypothetical protein [Barnesiella sp.]
MKTDKHTAVKVETVKDQIVIDSDDVRYAEELAVRRGHGMENEGEIVIETPQSGNR